MATSFCLIYLIINVPFSETSGVTLKSWQQETWDKILDRDGNITPSPSILSRFNSLEDKEYRLDERTYGFDLAQDFEWRRYLDGMRYWIGSIDHFRLITFLELKKQVNLFSGWDLGFLYRKVSSLEANRDLINFRFYNSHLLWNPLYFEMLIHPKYWKPSQDAELALGLKFSPDNFLEVRFAWLDLFNNSIIRLEEKFGKPLAERTYYGKLSMLLAMEAQWRLISRLRLELYGALSNRSRLNVRFLADPKKNFFREESFYYVGGLLEWHPLRQFLIAGYSTYVNADTTVKGEFPDFKFKEDQQRQENTMTAGIYLSFRPHSNWQVSAWTSWIHRPENRSYLKEASRSVNHRDIERLFSLEVGYDWNSNWRMHLSYLNDKRRAKGLAEAKFHLPNNRLELGLSYRFSSNLYVTIASNLELDTIARGAHESSLYDGSSMQLTSFW